MTPSHRWNQRQVDVVGLDLAALIHTRQVVEVRFCYLTSRTYVHNPCRQSAWHRKSTKSRFQAVHPRECTCSPDDEARRRLIFDPIPLIDGVEPG
jgi:hypothetical protein